uniref:Uncharacterized protein n=1 Tax=Oryzias latipes TaxID=8090 RepID=A0A3P9HCM6_ORYLA
MYCRQPGPPIPTTCRRRQGTPWSFTSLSQWNCSLEYCPIDGGLSPWGPWSSCSLSCGGVGVTTRSRGCTQPSPAHGGRDCQGPLQETTYSECAERNCTWTEWGEWSLCSRSCGVGQQQRIRTYFHPGTNGSWCEDIIGGNLENRFCNIRPLHGGWSRWSPWSRCDKLCGGGRSIRTRSCSSPPPKNGGETQDCQTPPCLDNLCRWSPWSPCSQSCGAGSASRRRLCLCDDDDGDEGDSCPPEIEAEENREETQLCYKQPCPGTNAPWSDWSAWSPCSASCGTGQQSSTRSVLLPHQYGGAPCEGPNIRTTTCSAADCGE